MKSNSFTCCTFQCRTLTLKDLSSGEIRVVYDAKEVISGLQTPVVKDPKVPKSILLMISKFLSIHIFYRCQDDKYQLA